MSEILNAAAKRMLQKMVEFTGRQDSLSKSLFAHHIARILGQYRIQCVIDVGANRGGFRHFLRYQVGYSGLILSFEPVRANVEVLQGLARKDQHWRIFDYALGNIDGSLPMNVMRQHEFSSFLKPDDSAVKEFRSRNQIQNTESVRICKLDSVLPEIRRQFDCGRVYLKLDTQGFDLEVLRGAVETLPSLPVVQTELSFQSIYERMPSFREVLDFLLAHGFQVSALSPVTHDSLLRVVESDCVLVNPRWAPAVARDLSAQQPPGP
jgi:FkbM family methyltransferase